MLKKLYGKPSSYKLKVFNEGQWWSVSLSFPTRPKKVDCLVSHPQKKLTFRTDKGLEVKRYSMFNNLISGIREEGKKYNLNFTRYKIIKHSLNEGKQIIKTDFIFKKIRVNNENIDTIMRIVCDSNNLVHPYLVIGVMYKKEFKLNDVLKGPIPLVSIVNKNDNFFKIKEIVLNNYPNLKRFDYKHRGYNYFTGFKPKTDGFLIPIKWFDYIKYSA